MISTRTPQICTHARLAGDAGDCEWCIERQVIQRFFRMLPGGDDDDRPHREFVPHPPRIHRHMGHAEQIGRYGSPNGRKYEKRRANRLRRRAERIDPENAPTKLIRGWND